MRYILPVLMLSACLQISCSNTRKSVTLAPVTVTAKTSGLDIYRASESRIWDITHTRAQLRFNYKERTASGKAWIDMRPYFYSTDSLQLDAKGMKIDTVMLVENGSRKPLTYTYSDNLLDIKFSRSYTAKDSIQVYISYTAQPYATATGGSKAISQDRGLYFINSDNSIPGKPVQIWTQGETEATSRWLPTIDAPNERLTVQLELTVPDSFITLSNGYVLAHIRAGKGLRTDIWRMDKQIQPYVIMFAVGDFAVVRDEWRRREVSYYVEPEYEPYARLMFKNTPEMMEFFSGITGITYPWNKYNQIVVRDYVSGAMENTTASVFGEFMNQNAREIADKDHEDIVSHELFHQWFGDYVTAESWSNLTLNESFANYGEQLWRKYKYGKASSDELAFSDLWAYLSSARTGEPPLVRFHYSEREDMFDRISYQKGGATLNYLHGLIGDSAFYKAMNIYLTQNALRPAEAHHWRLAVEEATGKDWNWFFNQWYYRGGHPRLDVKYTYDDDAKELQVTVTQLQDSLYILPLKSDLIYKDTKATIDWNLTQRKEYYTYPYQNGLKPVVVPDATYWLVGTIAENKVPEHWLTQYRNSTDNVLSKQYALAAVRKKLEDTSSQALFNLSLSDKDVLIRRLVLESLQREKAQKWQDKWKSNVAYLAVHDGSNKVRAAAFNTLGDWKIATSKADMFEALNDSSYMVAGAALYALSQIDKDTVYTLAKNLLKTDPKADLQSVVWNVIAKKGEAGDITLFENAANSFYSSSKINFAYSLSMYLEEVEDTSSFKRTLDIFRQLQASENISVYRSAIVGNVLQSAADYKERRRDSRTNAEKKAIEQKLAMLKAALDKIIAEEKEEDNKRRYRDIYKAIYE